MPPPPLNAPGAARPDLRHTQQDPNMGDYCRGKKRALVWNDRSLYLNTDLPCPDRFLARPADSQSWLTPPNPGSPGRNRAVLVQEAYKPSPLWNTDHIQNKHSRVLQDFAHIVLIYRSGIILDKSSVLTSNTQTTQGFTFIFWVLEHLRHWFCGHHIYILLLLNGFDPLHQA